MVTVILSPHFDDAVLSCWDLLTQPGEVTVINVFAGVPQKLDTPAWWDRYTGATDSGARVLERIEEDRKALAIAERIPQNLDLLDEQYRDGEQPLAPPTEQIARLLVPGAHIYAPAAFAGHPDHLLVRAAALELRDEGYPVSLYADLPHATVYGWPAWIGSSHSRPAKDIATAMWERALSATGISHQAMTPHLVELDAATYARKVTALRAYKTQVNALAELLDRPLSDRETLGYEVVWMLPSTLKASPVPAADHASPGS